MNNKLHSIVTVLLESDKVCLICTLWNTSQMITKSTNLFKKHNNQNKVHKYGFKNILIIYYQSKILYME